MYQQTGPAGARERNRGRNREPERAPERELESQRAKELKIEREPYIVDVQLEAAAGIFL